MFFIQENVPFNLPVTQSIRTSNEQMMKTKLHTFARKQILRKTVKNLLKYSVHMTKAQRKTSKPFGNHNYVFIQII